MARNNERQISARIEQRLLDRLHERVVMEDRTLNAIITRALVAYCDEAEQSSRVLVEQGRRRSGE